MDKLGQLVCPVCNGLKQLHRDCSMCHFPMTDSGQVENFLGPYSPFEEQLIFEQQESQAIGEGFCWHLLTCCGCGNEQRVPVECLPV